MQIGNSIFIPLFPPSIRNIHKSAFNFIFDNCPSSKLLLSLISTEKTYSHWTFLSHILKPWFHTKELTSTTSTVNSTTYWNMEQWLTEDRELVHQSFQEKGGHQLTHLNAKSFHSQNFPMHELSHYLTIHPKTKIILF